MQFVKRFVIGFVVVLVAYICCGWTYVNVTSLQSGDENNSRNINTLCKQLEELEDAHDQLANKLLAAELRIAGLQFQVNPELQKEAAAKKDPDVVGSMLRAVDLIDPLPLTSPPIVTKKVTGQEGWQDFWHTFGYGLGVGSRYRHDTDGLHTAVMNGALKDANRPQ